MELDNHTREETAMFHLTCENDNGIRERSILKVWGEMTLPNAGKVKAALLHAINSTLQVQVNLEAVTRIDLTAMQLLCAAHRCASRMNKTLDFVKTPGGEVKETVVAAGYSHHVDCVHNIQDGCMWRSFHE